MKEKSREVEERENESEGKALFSRVLFFFLAAFQLSEGRPCWVEHSSSLSFKSHSLSRFPLRISQRDQQRRESDRKTEKDGEKRQAADVKNGREVAGGGWKWGEI